MSPRNRNRAVRWWRHADAQPGADVMRPLSLVFFCAAVAACAPEGRAAGTPRVANGFTIERIATVDGAREVAAAPNGDLIVGTGGSDVYVVTNAGGSAGTPRVYAHFDSAPAAGVALADGRLFVGTELGVYALAYHTGERAAKDAPEKLASVRTGGAGGHSTTSVAFANGSLYASVGSSCNACRETDETRASIQRIDPATKRTSPFAVHVRNPIALTVNPATNSVWTGVAGVDDLPVGHPYEIFDDVSAHAAPADYGWPSCYENRQHTPSWPGSCSSAAVPRVVFPAYETPVGAVFYPLAPHGKYSFPQQYRGGAFVTLHGSWHGPSSGLSGYMPPRVVFVAMHGDTPARPVNWSDPTTQWTEFVGGYQEGGSNERTGRPTGITVGPDGSLFVADDETGAIYRVRPTQPYRGQ